MRASVEQLLPVLADRGAAVALVFLTLALVGMLTAGFGGLGSQARV